MRKLGLAILAVVFISSLSTAQELDFAPVSNEMSFFKNTDDDFDELGETLQIVSINSFKAITWFNFEFTGDFNWGMSEIEDYDYYIELSLVKPVTSRLSVNYQRVYGTFLSEPINQFGLRLSL